MKKWLLACSFALLLPGLAMAGPRLFVTGVTSYDPAKANNGFTILAGDGSAKMVDMNGNLVKEWDLRGSSAFPAKVFPGGHLIATIYPSYAEAGQGESALAVQDFDGKLLRVIEKLWKVERPGDNMHKQPDGEVWIARTHHDFQVEGDPVGYYSPNAKPRLDGKLMMLGHTSVPAPNKITDKMQLQDDRIFILDKDNKIIFEWKASDHIDEFKNMLTDPQVKQRLSIAWNAIGESPTPEARAKQQYNGFDWFHINCASWLGPNKWYDQDPVKYAMFHPENIIADSRETSHQFIIDHKTGKVVWQVAPPFTGEDADIKPVYGVHGTHMIPKGLPGEGNIIMFDNGGTTAYHDLPPRYYSRVVEYDPVTKKVVWEYSHTANKGDKNIVGPWTLYGDSFFYSEFISIAQRLPNGNTLITEGNKSRIFEVTPAKEIVWEYINPYTSSDPAMPFTYRAYRVPYDYVPQLPKGQEVKVTMPSVATIQLPNDNGALPKVAPTVDKERAARFATPNPVLTPALKNAAAPAAAKAAPAAAAKASDEPDEPGMKAY